MHTRLTFAKRSSFNRVMGERWSPPLIYGTGSFSSETDFRVKLCGWSNCAPFHSLYNQIQETCKWCRCDKRFIKNTTRSYITELSSWNLCSSPNDFNRFVSEESNHKSNMRWLLQMANFISWLKYFPATFVCMTSYIRKGTSRVDVEWPMNI